MGFFWGHAPRPPGSASRILGKNKNKQKKKKKSGFEEVDENKVVDMVGLTNLLKY
jgi:hypothetical protein